MEIIKIKKTLKRLEVKALPAIGKDDDYAKHVDSCLTNIEKQYITNQSWPQYETDAEASFMIMHDRQNLILKFEVSERELNAAVRHSNEEIHKDNCVELFIMFDDEHYYNLEFNCLGSAKIGYGKDKHQRTMLYDHIIKQIEVRTTLKYSSHSAGHRLFWDLVLTIPKSTFVYSTIPTFEGLICKANFQKCGDNLSVPHFLTWNKIDTDAPDFHQPKFFGELIFE
jgi:hypothetical protein